MKVARSPDYADERGAFYRHPRWREIWWRKGTTELWSSKIGTNRPRILDAPQRQLIAVSGCYGYWFVRTRHRRMAWGVRVHSAIVECAIGRRLIKGENVDHLNGNRADNDIDNLRPVTVQKNRWNITAVPRHNTSNRIGVSLYKRTGRWRASLTLNNTHMHLGYFATRDEAEKAYQTAKHKYHPQ